MEKATRVKYSLSEGKYTSNQSFLGNDGTLLKSVLDLTGGTVSVVAVGTLGELTTVETVECTSFTKAKTLAKAMLKKYGVTFFDEVRRKKTKEVA